jgi:hypothetical protein
MTLVQSSGINKAGNNNKKKRKKEKMRVIDLAEAKYENVNPKSKREEQSCS